MLRRLIIVVLVSVAALSPSAGTVNALHAGSPSGAVAVTVDRLVLAGIASERINPPRAARVLAYVSVAMFFGSQFSVGGAAELSTAVAARDVIAELVPSQTAAADGVVTATRARLSADAVDPKALDAATWAGHRIADGLRYRAAHDNAGPAPPAVLPDLPGVWQPTPPGFLPALEPAAGTWKTWNISSGSDFLPPAPVRRGERGYAEQVAAVYQVHLTRTPQQEAIALFWADGAGTVTPPGHWNQIALDLLASHPADLRTTTRVLAALNTAQADAFIACWAAKYHYATERPITAIRRDLDPSFMSFITTPPFPAYPSGHSTTSAAAARVLSAEFPDAAGQLQAWAQEAADSRLYGGIHFPIDNEAGLTLGQAVGDVAVTRWHL